MHGGGGSGGLGGGHGGLNGVKLEGPGGYYCNSYTPPTPNVVDHGLLAQAYSTFHFFLHFFIFLIWNGD
jgi:hypothetical protein